MIGDYVDLLVYIISVNCFSTVHDNGLYGNDYHHYRHLCFDQLVPVLQYPVRRWQIIEGQAGQ